MNRSLRQVLADSHIAAVTIVTLLLWSIVGMFQVIWEPASGVLSYLATALAIMGIPTASPLTAGDRIMLIETAIYLFYSVACFCVAWFLARWVYGAGPLGSLIHYYRQPTRRGHA
ncbi:MAG TPA: hypothetical protein VJW20_08830 [Candidatus Angelobacter sp.]|nr:hypothetical protein [Candidatus Angelobacter sp.]